MPEDFQGEHQRVLDEAMKVFVAKSHVRGQMWLDFPPSDKIRELQERVRRIENAYKARHTAGLTDDGGSLHVYEDAIIEDSIDIINYATFLVKQIRRGTTG